MAEGTLDPMPSTDPERAYHHGDLENVLRHVAAEVIAERGAAGFSLREVARRAGVSHAAPAHHYGDATGLLTAVAIEAFTHLHEAMDAGAAGIDDPVERLCAIGRSYVEVARSYPGHCAIVFRHDLVDPTDETYLQVGSLAYDFLRDALRALAEDVNPALEVETASRLCWAAMQGLVQLHPNMAALAEQDDLDPVPDPGDLAEVFVRLLVAGFCNPTGEPGT